MGGVETEGVKDRGMEGTEKRGKVRQREGRGKRERLD